MGHLCYSWDKTDGLKGGGMPTRYEVKIPTSGSAGSATGSADIDDSAVVNGTLVHIDINYDANAPATTDISIHPIRSDGSEGPAWWTRSNSNTDAFRSPSVATHDADDAEASARIPITLAGPIRVKVAGCDALAVAVRLELYLV